MLLKIKNLGKVVSAEVEINAITVIAGLNDSGKSTVGKALFSVLSSFYGIDSKIAQEKLSAINKVVEAVRHKESGRVIRRFDGYEFAEFIVEKLSESEITDTHTRKDVINSALQGDHFYQRHAELVDFDKVTNDILRIADISDDEALVVVLRNRLQTEFSMQINNMHCAADKMTEIAIDMDGLSVKISVNDNDKIGISGDLNLSSEIIYIDDPYAMDNHRQLSFLSPALSNNLSHREHLRMCLNVPKILSSIDEIITTKKLDGILERLNLVCPGEIIKNNNRSFAYKRNDTESSLDVKNVSTGLKTFAIIKTLLLNGSLDNSGMIILDEPEIHLHPEWQLIFAELIILMQKEFNMRILLNTHSPYFLKAIEVHSLKHGIANKIRYYITENSGNSSNILDVSDNIEAIYAKLARPLQDLENVRYS